MPNVVIARNTYPDDRALHEVIHYVLDKAIMVGGYGVSANAEAAYMQMQFVKRAFYQSDALQLKHFMISLDHTEAAYIDDDELLHLGFLTGQLFREYQMVYGIHMDGSHEHLHIVMNTTSFLDGHQYSDGNAMFKSLCGMLKRMYPRFWVNLCRTRGYTKENHFCDADRYQYEVLN